MNENACLPPRRGLLSRAARIMRSLPFVASLHSMVTSFSGGLVTMAVKRGTLTDLQEGRYEHKLLFLPPRVFALDVKYERTKIVTGAIATREAVQPKIC